MPSGIAKNISPPLYELMNGDTRESHNGCATLEHVEPETFGAFWSFVNNGDYDLAVDERSMDIVNPYIARRQNTEESDYGETGPLGLTRTLTDRLTSTEDDLPEDEIDSELNLKLKIRTTEIPLEPSAAVMAEKYDFGQSRQERKQDKKVQKPVDTGCYIGQLTTDLLFFFRIAGMHFADSSMVFLP